MRGKVSPYRLSEREYSSLRGVFFATLESYEREGLLLSFLEQMFTKSEMIMYARRIAIAKLLLRGESPLDIQQQLKVGQKTIESVNRWLSEYREYREVFPKAFDARARGHAPAFPESFAALRKRYPLHFLLFNLLLKK